MLGTLLTLGLILGLSYVTAVIPIRRAIVARDQRRFHEAYRAVKLRAVKRCYPELRGMGDREITTRFNVTEAYHKIGRAY